jgi:chromosomal replication initiator protein
MHVQLDASQLPTAFCVTIGLPPVTIEVRLPRTKGESQFAPNPRISIETIKEVVAQSSGTTVKRLDTVRRGPGFGELRQLAMYIVTELTNYSLPQIAMHFGKKDHTSVMYARDKIKEQMQRDEAYRNRVRELIATCKNASRTEDAG